MGPIRRVAICLLVVLAACTGPPDDGGELPIGASSADPTDPGPVASAEPTTVESPPSPVETDEPPPDRAFLPAPDAPIPRGPERLAARLVRTTEALRAAVEDWVAAPGEPAQPPRPVRLLGLHQQRIYRLMAHNPPLLADVIPLLPRWLMPEAEANSMGTARLLSLITPADHVPDLALGPPTPAGELLGYYRAAGERFGIDPWVLAAIHLVETKFSRVRSVSSAGAQGPMQFIPSTWDAYGLGGDVHDDRDAILGAANYLDASGAPGDYRRALFAYNHAEEYVDAVLWYAEQMRRDERDFFAYFSWQVYALTTEGDVRLSGPGLEP